VTGGHRSVSSRYVISFQSYFLMNKSVILLFQKPQITGKLSQEMLPVTVTYM